MSTVAESMIAKVRPCLVFSVTFRDNEKAVVTCVARSTQVRGGRFEDLGAHRSK